MKRPTWGFLIAGFAAAMIGAAGCNVGSESNLERFSADADQAIDDDAEPGDDAELDDEDDAVVHAVPPRDLVETEAVPPAEHPAGEEPQAAPLNSDGSKVKELAPTAVAESDSRQYRTAFYRADAAQQATIPPVVLSKGMQALCRVNVGDPMPAIELDQIGGQRQRLADLFGQRATVVVFWKSDRYMARQQIVDMGPDVIEPYGKLGVSVVGIAVNEAPDRAQAAMQRAQANFPNLLDARGEAFAQVGSEKLPRTYLLDPQGKILWFDIEYSLATRRELHQALRAVSEKQ